MSKDDLEEVLDGIVDILASIIKLICFIGLVITSPIWSIPYIVYKELRDKEDRENE